VVPTGHEARRPWRIGLTGGIGSGKSTVAAALARRGACIVDTDAIARGLTAPGGAALPAIAAAFGDPMITADGALDRDQMRRHVFADDTQRRRLETILHPLIGAQAQAQARQARSGQTIVFDVPLLAESAHWREKVDRILVIDCDEALQIARVMARSGWVEAEVRRVLDRQAPRAARRAIADAVIFNQGLSLPALDAEVERLWQCWSL
jgi:dephospho-CoA kinase